MIPDGSGAQTLSRCPGLPRLSPGEEGGPGWLWARSEKMDLRLCKMLLTDSARVTDDWDNVPLAIRDVTGQGLTSGGRSSG